MNNNWMNDAVFSTTVGRFFMGLTARPKLVVVLGIIGILGMGGFIPTLVKDTTPEAFVPPTSPAIVNRDRAKEIFGLADPMAIAVIDTREHGIYNPQTLALVQELTDTIIDREGIDPDRVTSLATENNISGSEYGMEVDPFWDYLPETLEEAAAVRTAIDGFPLYQGTLVSRDGKATIILAELIDGQKYAPQIYKDLLQLTQTMETPEGVEIHVAGQGAVTGYLAAYIASDAARMNPLAALMISLVLLLAYRSFRGVLLPNVVVAATAAGGIGMMAATGTAFYVITNSLPVILIGIAVADSIHILGQYYEELAHRPDASGRELAIRTMVKMWRPVTLTSITTIAGFAGLSIASNMPPMVYYGIFANVGIAVAWLYSLTFLPAALTLMKPKPSPSFKPDQISTGGDFSARMMTRLGLMATRHHRITLTFAAALSVVAFYGALKIEHNDERLRVFQKSEPVSIADAKLNEYFDGTYYLDVVVETPNKEDLFKPEILAKVQALQEFMKTLPRVENVTSIIDYLKQMNRVINEGRQEEYRLPDSAEAVAQYFLLYSTSSDPSDFEEEIDYDYRLALVRGSMKIDQFQLNRPTVQKLEAYIENEFNEPGVISGEMSGAVFLSYIWISPMAIEHFIGTAVALVMVLLAACLVFRSVPLGILATTPVIFAVLLVYAVMGYFNIWLGIGETMFAAIAIGLGIDFATHTLDRLRGLIQEQAAKGEIDFDAAVAQLYPSTGRALFFNFLALAMGFGLLMFSYVPPLNRFGILVAFAVFAAFFGSQTILPSLVKVLKPKAMGFK